MKKMFLIFFGIILLISFSGCSQNINSSQSNSNSDNYVVSDPFENNSEEKTPAQKAIADIENLGVGNILYELPEKDSVDDFNIEYNGGVISLPVVFQYTNSNYEELPEKMSVGCAVAINGILQRIKTSDNSEDYVYVADFSPSDNTSGRKDKYIAEKSEMLIFEPEILEKDKDLDKLQISLISIQNPHHIMTTDYIDFFSRHSTTTSLVMSLTLNSPIKKYTEATISEDGYSVIENDNKTDKKYGEMCWINSFKIGITSIYSNINSDGKSDYSFDNNGKMKIGFVSSVGKDSGLDVPISERGDYLIAFFLNGKPHPYPDGSMYKSVYMEPDKLYVFEEMDFTDIVKPTDGVAFFPIPQIRNDGKFSHSSRINPVSIQNN